MLLQRVSASLVQDGVEHSGERLLEAGLLEATPELVQGASATVIGLATGLGVAVVVILGFVGFGYLLYRVSR